MTTEVAEQVPRLAPGGRPAPVSASVPILASKITTPSVPG